MRPARHWRDYRNCSPKIPSHGSSETFPIGQGRWPNFLKACAKPGWNSRKYRLDGTQTAKPFNVRMSAFDPKQTWASALQMSAFRGKDPTAYRDSYRDRNNLGTENNSRRLIELSRDVRCRKISNASARDEFSARSVLFSNSYVATSKCSLPRPSL